MDNKNEMAIRLRNVNFSYRKSKSGNKVLDNASISVPYGKIYALLGPSGCGKTTLLKVAMGKFRCKGDVQVFQHQPNSSHSFIPGPNVGYMPQELALHSFITIKETLWLFGQLNLMDKSILKERVDEVIRILALPPGHVCVDNLSGGQKRRVSLAMTLLHNPPLLILDEPTVGLDPLLRKEIWTHLVHLSNTQNTTIVVTTHYIEEAKDAHIISAMKKGRILLESTPSAIVTTFEGKNLEDSFLKIFTLDVAAKGKGTFNELVINESPNTLKDVTDSYFPTDGSKNVKRIARLKEPYFLYRMKILCQRNILLWRKNIIHLINQINTPILTVLIFILAMGRHMTGVKVGLVDEDSGNDYFQSLDRSLMSLTESNFSVAYDTVKRGEAWAFLHVRKNFTDCLKQKLIDGVNVDEDTLNCSSISVYYDLSNLQIYYTLINSFIKTYHNFVGDILESMNKTRAASRYLLDMSYAIYGSPDTTSGESMMPGVILTTANFLTAASTTVGLSTERLSGVSDRIRMCGATNVDRLLSMYTTELLKVVVMTVTMFVCTFCFFEITLLGSVVTLVFLTIFQGLQGVAFGLLLSASIDGISGAVFLNQGVSFLNIIGGGIIWPLEGMPTVMKKCAYYLVPAVMPNEAFKAVMSKGLGFESSVVCLGFVSTFAWIFIYMGFTLLVMKYKR